MDDGKVIGGEFAVPLYLGMDKPDGVGRAERPGRRFYASGRTALYAILNAVADAQGEYGGVLVPDYICVSVTRTIRDAGHDFSFYQIGHDFSPVMESLRAGLQKEKIVLLVNYFGLVDLEKAVSSIREESGGAVVIIDDVQNYYGFGQACDFDYAFTSFRKWFPVPDGAEVVTRNRQLGEGLGDIGGRNEFAQYKFAGNVLKNFRQKVGSSVYLDLIEKGERVLDGGYRCECSGYSFGMMEVLDREDYAGKRKRNAEVLHKGLDRIGITNIYRGDAVPLFVPALLENRTEVRERLAAHNIFCPVHWPWESGELQGCSPLYDMERSLVCDQRYDEGDMELILEILEHECVNQ